MGSSRETKNSRASRLLSAARQLSAQTRILGESGKGGKSGLSFAFPNFQAALAPCQTARKALLDALASGSTSTADLIFLRDELDSQAATLAQALQKDLARRKETN